MNNETTTQHSGYNVTPEMTSFVHKITDFLVPSGGVSANDLLKVLQEQEAREKPHDDS